MIPAEIKEYIISVRRELHRVPEVAFELPKTVAIIKRELDSMGIPYVDGIGICGIVATINGESRGKTIALRADMDALPIKEATGLPFSSTHDGMMHACGHDCHMAMLLGAAKILKAEESSLPCRVKLIFQPAEEAAPGGAKLMCEDGCTEGIDAIYGAHVNTALDCGKIAFNYGKLYASSHGFLLTLKGKSCHVCSPQSGVDAIAMAARVFTDIQFMRARELDPKQPVIIGVGEIHGGEANNIVCDKVVMHGTIRTLDDKLDEKIFSRIESIANSVSLDMGGGYEMTTTKHYPVLINEKEATAYLEQVAVRVLGRDNVFSDKLYTLGAEDFAFYLQHTKGAYFSVGVGTKGQLPSPAHNCSFTVNEDGLTAGTEVFAELARSFK